MGEITKPRLAEILARARELERLAAIRVGDLACQKDGVGSVEKVYEDYGVRAFPVADALCRNDVPALVEEIKRLRGWACADRSRALDDRSRIGRVQALARELGLRADLEFMCPKCGGAEWGGFPERSCHGTESKPRCGFSWHESGDAKHMRRLVVIEKEIELGARHLHPRVRRRRGT